MDEIAEVQKALQGKAVQEVTASTTEEGEIFSVVLTMSDGSKVSIAPTRNRSLEILTG
jgi:hypothetical protein